MPRIPLIEDLTTASVPAGSNLLVEFDPTSLWYAASLTIAAEWLRSGGGVSYNTLAQPPDNIRTKLRQLGLNVEDLELNDKLRIWDWYSLTLGQKSKEKYAPSSLKVADTSIFFSKEQMRGPPDSERLRISDNGSTQARFNDEKAWIEYYLTRVIPMGPLRKTTWIAGVIRGIHSDLVYKQLEAAFDGVVDFKLDEVSEGKTSDLMRIRSMRNAVFVGGWHRLKVGENFEVTLVK